jgi:hypothetical protein
MEIASDRLRDRRNRRIWPCAANGSTLTGTAQTIQLVPGHLSATNHFLDISANNGKCCWNRSQPSRQSRSRRHWGCFWLVLGLAGMPFQRRRTVQV